MAFRCFGVGDLVGVVVENAFRDWNVEVNESAHGFIGLCDIFGSEKHSAVCAEVGPIGVLGEDEDRFIAVPNGHDAW